MDDRALRCVSFELSDFSLGFFFFFVFRGRIQEKWFMRKKSTLITAGMREREREGEKERRIVCRCRSRDRDTNAAGNIDKCLLACYVRGCVFFFFFFFCLACIRMM